MQYLRRLIWYIASRLLIILIVLGLVTTAFYFSMNAANIYVILKDGMAKRAQVIMMDSTVMAILVRCQRLPSEISLPMLR